MAQNVQELRRLPHTNEVEYTRSKTSTKRAPPMTIGTEGSYWAPCKNVEVEAYTRKISRSTKWHDASRRMMKYKQGKQQRKHSS